MVLNVSVPSGLVNRLKESFPFAWSDTHIPYLRDLRATFELLYKYNYPPLFSKLEVDLQQWSLHNLSWLGRIHTIKMTLLLRLLYFFRSFLIPIFH